MTSPAAIKSSLRVRWRTSTPTATIQVTMTIVNSHGWLAPVQTSTSPTSTFTAGGQFTRGLAPRWMNQLATSSQVCNQFEAAVGPEGDVLIDCLDFDQELQEAFGVTAGLTFNVNDTTSINLEGG